MKRLVAAVGCSCLMMIASACGTSSGTSDSEAPAGEIDPRLEKLYDKAKQEGELTWYNQFVPENEEQILEAFRATFPEVEVNSLRLTGAKASQRFFAERSAGATSADVVSQSQEGAADEALEKGWAEELTAEDVPTLGDFPEKYVRGAEVVNAIAPIRLTVNTELVDEPPGSWEELVDPAYEGEIIIADPRAILPWMTLFDVLRQEYGTEYLEGLADQDFQLVESAVPGSQSLAAGEAKALMPSLDSVSNPLIEEGAPVENVSLSPTTGVENTSMISTDAEHPDAARLFVAWLCTEEGQAAVNGDGFGASPLGEVDGALELPDDYRSPDGESANEHRDAIIDALDVD